MDGGLTHTVEGNALRSWDFEWITPADDSQFAEFTICGNAVNGGDGFEGDMWNSYETTIAGISAGEMAPSVESTCAVVNRYWTCTWFGFTWSYLGILFKVSRNLQHLQFLELSKAMANNY